jgi:hypothetical protein
MLKTHQILPVERRSKMSQCKMSHKRKTHINVVCDFKVVDKLLCGESARGKHSEGS